MRKLYPIMYCIILVFVCVGFIIYFEPLMAYVAYFVIEPEPKRYVDLEPNKHFKGMLYLYVSTLIIFNIVLGSICFGFNSTQELVVKIKAQKLSGNVSSLYPFFLTLRFYLTAIASALVINASLYATSQILFNKHGSFYLDINVFIFILLLFLHLMITYFRKTAKGQIFFQVFALVIVNGVFVILSLQGHVFESLTISEFNIGASVVVAIICQLLKPTNQFLDNINKFAFLFIGNKKDSVRKRFVSLRRLQPFEKAVQNEKYYFLSLYSFMTFTKIVCWTFNYYLSSDKKEIIENQYSVASLPTFVFVTLISVFLTFQLLRWAARYNYSLGKQRYYVPLDFCVLYEGLVKPLIDLSYETWLIVHHKSVRGFGLTLLNPAAICITKDYSHYVMYIASPAEGFWNFMTVGLPSVVRDFANLSSIVMGHSQERKLKNEMDLDNLRLEGCMPYVQLLKKAGTKPKDQELLEKFSQLTFQNANPRYTLSESSASIAARDAILSEIVNTSDLCKGVCPVSPRSGLTKVDQFTVCLKNAAEKAATIIENQI